MWFLLNLLLELEQLHSSVTLAAGTRLGPYEVVAPIGAGRIQMLVAKRSVIFLDPSGRFRPADLV